MAKQETNDVALQNVIANVKEDFKRTVESLCDVTLEHLSGIIADAIKDGRKIYLTGIGKPSFVAMKNAMTLKSIEVDAEYLDACTAGHGDLGSMPADALVIALSKSGKSTELKTLFTNLASCRPNVKAILLTFNEHIDDLIALYQSVNNLDIASVMTDPKEFDGYGLIPSSSNAGFEAALSICFACAMTLLGEPIELHRRLQRSHPSGTLQTKVSKLIAQEEQQ